MNVIYKKISIAISCVLLCSAVLSQSSSMNEAKDIVNKAIEAHGGSNFDQMHISFTFRSKKYTIELRQGIYEYTRKFTDSTGIYIDRLTNDDFTRSRNGKILELSEKDKTRLSNSVNSVAYFTLLPKPLNDGAVNKKLLGKTKIKGKEYHLLEVTFNEDGGGDDHEDKFLYWINTQDFTMEYLAYSYKVNGGGVRFREAVQRSTVGGLIFQNYINYKPASKKTSLIKLPKLFEAGELIKLSEIINENVQLVKV